MLQFLKNSQIRILFSGSLFTAAFIWMAVTAYSVDEQEIKVFLIMSFLVLGVLIAAGSLFALVLFAIRRSRQPDNGLLAKIESIERETEQASKQMDGDTGEARPANDSA